MALMSRAWMTFGLNLRRFDGESGVTGSNLLTRVDSSSLVGERATSLGRLLRTFLRRFGELGLEETIVGLLSVEFILWGSEDVAPPGTSSCRALYKSCISWTEADTRRRSNIAAARLGSISELAEASAKCFPPGGVACDWISEKQTLKK